jgi:hypothetical protein
VLQIPFPLLSASPSRVPIEDVGYGTRIATVVPSVTVNPRRFSTIGTIDRDCHTRLLRLVREVAPEGPPLLTIDIWQGEKVGQVGFAFSG